MSWLINIAEKAEDLLNKIDQNAAVALNTENESSPHRPRSKSKGFDNTSEFVEPRPYPNENFSNGAHDGTTFVTVTKELPSPKLERKVNTISSNSSSLANQKMKPSSKKTSSMKPSGPKKSSQARENNNIVKVEKTTDNELMQFLNTNDVGINESSMLKTELASQTREIGILIKNQKGLEEENNMLRKTISVYECSTKEAKLPSTQISKEKDILQIRSLESELMEKKMETSKLRELLDQSLCKLQSMGEIQEAHNRVAKLELEKEQMGTRSSELEEKLNSLIVQLEELKSQMKSAKEHHTLLESEYNDYKEKAKAILKSKDDFIASMKSEDGPNSNVTSEPQLLAEIISLRNERELLSAEVGQNRSLTESLREENSRLEVEVDKLRAASAEASINSIREKQLTNSYQDENLAKTQLLSALHIDLEREKIERQKVEEALERLKAESSTRMTDSHHSHNSYDDYSYDENENLRTRINALSQSLLEKQSQMNEMGSENQLLNIRLERLQAVINQMNESSETPNNGFLTHTIVSNQPLYLSESPWDSRVTSKVKRVYSQVDSFCCQIGLAMRHRPTLRLGFSAYILILHMWVFFVLFSWSHHGSVAVPNDRK